MVERMQCNIQSDAITLTTLKYSAVIVVGAVCLTVCLYVCRSFHMIGGKRTLEISVQ